MFDADARKAELQAIYDEGDGGNWAPIKEIATGLGITKPEAGWEAAIALIVEVEASQQPQEEPEQPANAETEEEPEQVSQISPQDTPWRKPRTDLHGNIIPNPWQS